MTGVVPYPPAAHYRVHASAAEAHPKWSDDPVESVASMFSIMRDMSVPMGIATPSKPNVAATLWRTVSDRKNRIYYFDSTSSPNVFWLSLDKLKLGQGGQVEKLDLAHGAILAGDVADRFQPADAFKFLLPAP
jgi:penicillin V acylase-like amidase (Ntn superfamily)